MNHFVVVVNGEDFFIDCNEIQDSFYEENVLKTKIQAIPYFRDKRVPYGVTEKNVVPVYKIIVKDGKQTRSRYRNIEFDTWQNDMTQEIYDELAKDLLSNIPKEFHKFLLDQAYERGHSAGFSEMWNHLQDYYEGLYSPIKCFEKRIRYENLA